ncbi:MAG TPA: amino acid permease [Candidatus Sumerlaeia bacterium]|nr:amino acid permease [Candidatus Sumerlaeia bacterium]
MGSAKLKKELNLLDVYSIITGSIVGAGLFLLPGLAHEKAGAACIFSYLLAGLLASTAMFSMAEMVSAMPKAGGDYFVVKRIMGPAIGTIAGLLSWFFLSLKSALALLGMAMFTSQITSMDIRFISLMFALLFIIINILGVKEAGWTQVVMTLGLIALLLIYILRGFWAIDVRRFQVFAPKGFMPVIYTMGLIFVTYGGILKCVSVAEEIQNPGRTIPLGMILSLLTVSIVYTLAVFVTSGVMEPEMLHKSKTPLNAGASIFMGRAGTVIMLLAAILACITTANGGIMAASRYPLALSRDGLLPNFFNRINKRFQTPHIAILATGAFIILSLFLNLEGLAKTSSTVLILTYILANLCILIIRESRIQNYQPSFRSPLYPWLQIFGIIGFLFLIFEMGMETLLISLALGLGGFLVYWYYGRARAVKESALLHLMQRVTDKDLGLSNGALESELKNIIREREGLVNDRFDELIEKCKVLDIDKKMQIEELFKLVAESMSHVLSVPKDELFNELIRREKENTTVISSTIAIPHVIIEGNNMFDILLVRCKEGVAFSEEVASIHTVFVLMGTRDERNFHLRALSAIAQIVQGSHFEKRWMSAKNSQALRDIILLGTRKRYL